MKNDRLKDRERKKDTEELLGSALTEERFALLVNLGKKISDFGNPGDADEDEENIDENYGINVQFQESDEEDEMDIEGNEDEDDEEENGIDQNEIVEDASGIRVEGSEGDKNRDQKSKNLHPLDIDAHWLQRKLSKYFDDATVSQKKSKDVMEILKNADNDRECENHLVLLLGYDCFDFIKILLKNRDMITYCIQLKMAQSDEERDKIVSEMKKRSHLRRILNQLEGEDDEEAKENLSKEAKKAAENQQEMDSSVTTWEMMNLDELAFANGSHFMANKRCQLPEGSYRKQEKGYEEVHVPALKPKTFGGKN